MDYKDVKRKFKEFKQKQGGDAILKLDDFFEKIKEEYLKEKTQYYINKGHSPNDAHNRARQSWRPKVGDFLEQIIRSTIVDLCDEYDVEITSDSELKRQTLNSELDLVRRMLEVHYNSYSFLPDADLVLYRYDGNEDKVNILCILSFKTSFRERYTETPYWKLKLKENKRTCGIDVFMVSPDNSDEISYKGKGDGSRRRPRKARIIMEYELDGIYLIREDFDASEKVKGIEELQNDLKDIFNG